MNQDLTFVIRNKYGKTYFAFTDPEFGVLFEPVTPSKTKASFLGWWNMNKGSPFNIGVPYDVSSMVGITNKATITCLLTNETNNKENNNEDESK